MFGIAAILLHPLKQTAGDWRKTNVIYLKDPTYNEIRGDAGVGGATVYFNGKGSRHNLPVPASEFV